MNMKMENHLATGSLVELLDGDAVGRKPSSPPWRFLRGRHDVCQIVGADIENVAGGAFGSTRVCPGERGMMQERQ